MAIQDLSYSSLLNYIHVNVAATQQNARYLSKHGLRFQSHSEFVIWASSKALKPTEKKLLEVIYFSGLSMSQIAQKLGVSRQFIQKKHVYILGKLNNDDIRSVA
jgi:DNA-directed RNA polymerase specialized sigma subunit